MTTIIPNGTPLSRIAQIIKDDWKNLSPHAKPYVDAMSCIKTVNDEYGCDMGVSVVFYFLSNASSWRGEVARTVKAHLKQLVKEAK